MANNFTGKNASDVTVTFSGREYTAVQYPGAVLFFESAGSPVLVSSTNPLPVSIPASNNNIGDVDVASIAAGNNNIGNVDIESMPGSAALTDTVGVKLCVDAMQNDLTALTPKRALISANTATNTSLVAAVPAKSILVTGIHIVTAGAQTVSITDGSGGTSLSGVMTLASGTPFSPGFHQYGWFKTTAATALFMTTTAAVQTSGFLTYVEV